MTKIDRVIWKAEGMTSAGKVAYLEYHLELQRIRQEKLMKELEEVENNITTLRNLIARLREEAEKKEKEEIEKGEEVIT